MGLKCLLRSRISKLDEGFSDYRFVRDRLIDQSRPPGNFEPENRKEITVIPVNYNGRVINTAVFRNRSADHILRPFIVPRGAGDWQFMKESRGRRVSRELPAGENVNTAIFIMGAIDPPPGPYKAPLKINHRRARKRSGMLLNRNA